MRVAGRNACRALNDSGAAFAVWEQVRTAIAAASLTAAARSVFTTTIAYERTLEPDARRVRTQTSTVHSGYVREPWGSRSPEQLHADGYVVTDRDNVTAYYAPGLEVLLSPAFIDDYCFHLTRDHDRLGLAFEPNPDRRKTSDIRGTLWLDASSAELRTMEFGYSNVLAEQEAVARGEASFIRMANGMWAISRWTIRMPVLEQVVTLSNSGATGAFSRTRGNQASSRGGSRRGRRAGSGARGNGYTVEASIARTLGNGRGLGVRQADRRCTAVADRDERGRFHRLPGLLFDAWRAARRVYVRSANAVARFH